MAIAGYPILSRKEEPKALVYYLLHPLLVRKKRQGTTYLSPSMSEQDRKEEEEQERIKIESRHNRLQQKILLVSLAILAGYSGNECGKFAFPSFSWFSVR